MRALELARAVAGAAALDLKPGRALPVSLEGPAGGEPSLVPELSVRVNASRCLAARVRSASPTWLRPNPVVVGALVGGA